MTAFLPMRRRPSPSPTVVVVLPSPAGGRGNGGDENQATLRPARQRRHGHRIQLGNMAAVRQQGFARQAKFGTDLRNGGQFCRAGNFNIAVHCHSIPLTR